MEFIPSNSGSPPGEPGRLRRGDSFIFARGSVGPGPLETFRGAASGILGDRREFNIYIYIYIYISPNSFPGLVPPPEIPWRRLGFCGGSRAKCPFSGQDWRPARETSVLGVESDVFYCAHWPRFRAPLNSPTLSRIRTCRALAPANGATRQKRAR